MPGGFFDLEEKDGVQVLRLVSQDGTNRLTCAAALALIDLIRKLASDPKPLIITGNPKFFSAGADLREIADLSGPAAYEFSKMGQTLMDAVETFPAPVYAAVSGYCMGGGLDLALACHRRIASRDAIFGHRGAALGLITGWGGTQRLPRVVGKARALQMFVAAEKLHATEALQSGLIDKIEDDPVSFAIQSLASRTTPPQMRSSAFALT
jgi:enoyl-CoA hydratase